MSETSAGTQRLTFGLAETDADRREVFHLRYQAVLERHWAAPNELDDEMERDADDDVALHVVARNGDRIAGTTRLVLDRDRVNKLLHEHRLDSILAVEGTGFGGRLVIERSYRHRVREIFVGFAAVTWRACHQHGIHRLVSFTAENALRFYRAAGLPLRVIGDPEVYAGAERFPVVLDEEIAAAFLQTVPEDELRRSGLTMWLRSGPPGSAP